MTKKQLDDISLESTRAKEQAETETAQLIIPTVPKTKTLCLNLFALITFTAGLIIIIYSAYLFFWPQHPLVVKSVAVITPVVKSPGSLTYRINVCKNTSLTPIVYRKIVQDNVGAVVPPSQGVATRGCRTTDVSIQVPAGIKPGDHYVLYSDITYHINALRDVHVFWHSQKFTIIN